ncbi:MAG: hypothetical protein QOJ73_181 [Streptosporangiaceae bacterium]|jgi:hypothetical protein|nr:hypothetical protein [Streptosporangiaceae bacterium]
MPSGFWRPPRGPIFIPSGDTALTRRTRQASSLSAVVASVRHEDTSYDSLLMSGVPRAAARDQVRAAIDRVLADWAR